MAEIPAETKAAICDHLFEGRKIAAIKLYREATGEGLKESKDFVDALEARLREESPEKFTGPERIEVSGTSCVVVLAALITLGVGAALFLFGL